MEGGEGGAQPHLLRGGGGHHRLRPDQGLCGPQTRRGEGGGYHQDGFPALPYFNMLLQICSGLQWSVQVLVFDSGTFLLETVLEGRGEPVWQVGELQTGEVTY